MRFLLFSFASFVIVVVFIIVIVVDFVIVFVVVVVSIFSCPVFFFRFKTHTPAFHKATQME